MIDKKIKTLKKRVSIFKKLIKNEDAAIDKLRYKSRNIRLNNTHVPRKNWYIDRMQELQLIISFMESKIDDNKFVHYKLDDPIGEICQLVGNCTFVNN